MTRPILYKQVQPRWSSTSASTSDERSTPRQSITSSFDDDTPRQSTSSQPAGQELLQQQHHESLVVAGWTTDRLARHSDSEDSEDATTPDSADNSAGRSSSGSGDYAEEEGAIENDGSDGDDEWEPPRPTYTEGSSDFTPTTDSVSRAASPSRESTPASSSLTTPSSVVAAPAPAWSPPSIAFEGVGSSVGKSFSHASDDNSTSPVSPVLSAPPVAVAMPAQTQRPHQGLPAAATLAPGPLLDAGRWNESPSEASSIPANGPASPPPPSTISASARPMLGNDHTARIVARSFFGAPGSSSGPLTPAAGGAKGSVDRTFLKSEEHVDPEWEWAPRRVVGAADGRRGRSTATGHQHGSMNASVARVRSLHPNEPGEDDDSSISDDRPSRHRYTEPSRVLSLRVLSPDGMVYPITPPKSSSSSASSSSSSPSASSSPPSIACDSSSAAPEPEVDRMDILPPVSRPHPQQAAFANAAPRPPTSPANSPRRSLAPGISSSPKPTNVPAAPAGPRAFSPNQQPSTSLANPSRTSRDKSRTPSPRHRAAVGPSSSAVPSPATSIPDDVISSDGVDDDASESDTSFESQSQNETSASGYITNDTGRPAKIADAGQRVVEHVQSTGRYQPPPPRHGQGGQTEVEMELDQQERQWAEYMRQQRGPAVPAVQGASGQQVDYSAYYNSDEYRKYMQEYQRMMYGGFERQQEDMQAQMQNLASTSAAAVSKQKVATASTRAAEAVTAADRIEVEARPMPAEVAVAVDGLDNGMGEYGRAVGPRVPTGPSRVPTVTARFQTPRDDVRHEVESSFMVASTIDGAQSVVPPSIISLISEIESTLVMPSAPTDEEKLLYVKSDKALLYVYIIISFLLSQVGMWLFIIIAPSFYIVVIYAVADLICTGTCVYLVLRSPPFDYRAHLRTLDRPLTQDIVTGQVSTLPTVDVYLPCCGEPTRVLLNTYTHVARLDWPAIRVHVLDDGPKPVEVEKLARAFGFNYMRRRDRPHLKKAGNLRHAFQRTRGEFFVIFDADFCPRPEFLRETVPYMLQDPKLAIVQTPQFFRVSEEQTWVERGASLSQEFFYRLIQVSLDSCQGAVCVGSCALYRREALELVGGTVAAEHSEDILTGFICIASGWSLKYLPVNLAVGLCPHDLPMFFNQQYRWACGATTLVASRHFWSPGARVTLVQRLCFLTGFLYYWSTALSVVITPLPGLLLLCLRPDLVRWFNVGFAIPAILGTVALWVWFRRESAYGWYVLKCQPVQYFAHLFAVKDSLLGTRMDWVPSGEKDRRRQSGTFASEASGGRSAVATTAQQQVEMNALAERLSLGERLSLERGIKKGDSRTSKYNKARWTAIVWKSLVLGMVVAASVWRIVGGLAFYQTIPVFLLLVMELVVSFDFLRDKSK
ncbi:hypothetical protein HK101_011464 [Irineochytrium annulatum]|nr:hypothetical protein HK101_011464 [Irineochytrium annulatum]